MNAKYILTAGVLAVSTALLLTSTAQAQPPQYVVYDLGSFGYSSDATAINNLGQAVGRAGIFSSPGGTPSGAGVIYSGGTVSLLPFPSDFGIGFNSPSGINDVGQIIQNESGPNAHGSILTGGVEIGFGLGSAAFGINNSGQVTGLDGAVLHHAFLYSGGTMHDLGTLGGNNSQGHSINNNGDVAGFAVDGSGLKHAFVYSGGVMRDLHTLAGDIYWSSSEGNAINDFGQVAGITTVANGVNHAFLYSGGVMQDLGTLGGTSTATGINNPGQVVGYSNGHAFLDSGGTMYDLNDLAVNLSSTNFSYLNVATDINDNGTIVGYAITSPGGGNDAVHAFMAVPVSSVPEPATCLIGLLCLGIGLSRRRRA